MIDCDSLSSTQQYLILSFRISLFQVFSEQFHIGQLLVVIAQSEGVLRLVEQGADVGKDLGIVLDQEDGES